MGESHKHNAERKKPDSLKYVFSSSFYINFINFKNSPNQSVLLEIRIVVTFELKGITNGHKVEEGPQGVGHVLFLDLGAVYTDVYSVCENSLNCTLMS